MSVVMKLLRIIVFMGLYFLLCVIVVATVFANWPAGAQMLFAFGTPIMLVWWGERKRANKLAQSKGGERFDGEASSEKESPEPHKSQNSHLEAGFSAPASVLSKSTPQNKPHTQDYAAITEASRQSEESAHAKIAEKKEQPRTIKRKSSRHIGWLSSSETINVGGREIGGMVYVGSPPRLNNYGYKRKCGAYIDPSLSVARDGTDKSGHYLPYWPSYSEIPSQCRATYLDWLASGRSDPSYAPGYLFLYFYGLERRFVCDEPHEDEKWEILREVQRLKELYPDNGSVQRYLGEFIQLAQTLLNDEAIHEPLFERRGWELPLPLKVAIGGQVRRGELLSADWVLSWLMCHPECSLRTAARRCAREFRALFRLRFEAQFPDGLAVNKPNKLLKHTYRAASGEFQGQVEFTVNGDQLPDISILRKPIKIAQKIADSVMDDLDKLSRYLGRNPDSRGTVEAHALMPQELWDLFPSKELDALRDWAANVVADGGLIPVLDVVARLENHAPEKLNKRILTGAADALARIGYGFAPDPRFALRSPKLDEPVMLFALGEAVSQLEDVSDNYRAALIEMALGSFVVHADGQITESEKQSLLDKAMDIEGLGQQEYRRLAANVEWMLAVAPDMTLLRRKLKETNQEAMVSIRAALVAAAHTDGVIHSEEVAGIEKIYKALGLDPALVYTDLHAGDVADAPVRVRAAEPGAAGEAIPDEAPPSGPTRLNPALIEEIQKKTARVSSILGDIFNETPETLEEAKADKAILDGLDAKHANLTKALIAQDHWTEDAFTKLCRDGGLLASGAIENINEWAHDIYDEVLLDKYDGYEVSADLAAKLKKKFEEEIPYVEA